MALAGRYGYVDHTGKDIIEPKFEEAHAFSHGVAAVRSGGKFGYIDPQGQWVIEPTFTHAEDFGAQGLAAVSTMVDANGAPTSPAASAGPGSSPRAAGSAAKPTVAPASSREAP